VRWFTDRISSSKLHSFNRKRAFPNPVMLWIMRAPARRRAPPAARPSPHPRSRSQCRPCPPRFQTRHWQ
jgi:hypothetical protein